MRDEERCRCPRDPHEDRSSIDAEKGHVDDPEEHERGSAKPQREDPAAIEQSGRGVEEVVIRRDFRFRGHSLAPTGGLIAGETSLNSVTNASGPKLIGREAVAASTAEIQTAASKARTKRSTSFGLPMTAMSAWRENSP